MASYSFAQDATLSSNKAFFFTHTSAHSCVLDHRFIGRRKEPGSIYSPHPFLELTVCVKLECDELWLNTILDLVWMKDPRVPCLSCLVEKKKPSSLSIQFNSIQILYPSHLGKFNMMCLKEKLCTINMKWNSNTCKSYIIRHTNVHFQT